MAGGVQGPTCQQKVRGTFSLQTKMMAPTTKLLTPRSCAGARPTSFTAGSPLTLVSPSTSKSQVSKALQVARCHRSRRCCGECTGPSRLQTALCTTGHQARSRPTKVLFGCKSSWNPSPRQPSHHNQSLYDRHSHSAFLTLTTCLGLPRSLPQRVATSWTWPRSSELHGMSA